ncbi:hypothetical protein [Pantanalinema sp. GBBB05]|uniref:hypothetical protein n=1 Tax=Pantanalinema sp. GBBB05 TaxID=2604139 RepID=UPI001D1E6AC0|nr:transposase family protein [Pantanalinema sp. GBBB05]
MFFPLFQFEAVSARAVQQGLQQLFERWGLPQAVRVDNGQPWGCRSDLPSELMLWLIGLGVAVIHNRPYQPTDNARIERTHGTTKAWVEPSQCPDLTTLQQRLDWSANVQRAQYPSCSGYSRQQCYPQLTANPRRYSQPLEAQQWSLTRVLTFLAPQRWVRKVDSTGRISLFNRSYPVGRRFQAHWVYVHLDVTSLCWVIESAQGEILSSPPSCELSAQTIRELRVLYRKPSRQRRPA